MRLLCKRFNVKPPAHVMVDPGGAMAGSEGDAGASLPQRNLELVGKREMEEMMREGNIGGKGMRAMGASVTQADPGMDGGAREASVKKDEIIVDPEQNEALEKERPSDAMFKAVFGSESEEE